MNNLIYYKSRKPKALIRHALINDLYHNLGEFPDKSLNYCMLLLDDLDKAGTNFKNFGKDIQKLKDFLKTLKSQHCLIFTYSDWDTFEDGHGIKPIIAFKEDKDFPSPIILNGNKFLILGKALHSNRDDCLKIFQDKDVALTFHKTNVGKLSDELFLADFIYTRENEQYKMFYEGGFDGVIVEITNKNEIEKVYMFGSVGLTKLRSTSKYISFLAQPFNSKENLGLGNNVIYYDVSQDKLIRSHVMAPLSTIYRGTSTNNLPRLDKDERLDKDSNPVIVKNYSHYHSRDRQMGFQPPGDYRRTLDKIPVDQHDIVEIVFKQKVTHGSSQITN